MLSYRTPSRLQLCGRREARGLSSPSSKEAPSRRRVVGTCHLSMPGAARTAVRELAAPAASSPDVAAPRVMLSPHPASSSFGELFPPSSWPGRAASCLRESGAPAQPVLTFPKTLAAARQALRDTAAGTFSPIRSAMCKRCGEERQEESSVPAAVGRRARGGEVEPMGIGDGGFVKIPFHTPLLPR